MDGLARDKLNGAMQRGAGLLLEKTLQGSRVGLLSCGKPGVDVGQAVGRSGRWVRCGRCKTWKTWGTSQVHVFDTCVYGKWVG